MERAGLMVDPTSQFNVYLVDIEIRASLGLICGVAVKLLPGVTQKWDFWVVPLAMKAILGTPWLHRL